MNRVCLVGRITQKPELRYTNGNIAVTRFTIAVNRQFTNQQGQREADYITAVAWRKAAETICNYMDKGSQMSIEGRIQTGSYDDKDGKKVYTTEIIVDNFNFLESKAQADASRQSMGSNDFSQPMGNVPNNDNVSPYDYQSDNSKDNGTSVENDPFAEYGDMVQIDDNFLE